MRTYPDGEPIPKSLPPAYQPASNADVPDRQRCSNCGYFESTKKYCELFKATVRPAYWCKKWKPMTNKG